MKIQVCAGARCTMLGSDIIYNRLSDFVEEFNDRIYTVSYTHLHFKTKRIYYS